MNDQTNELSNQQTNTPGSPSSPPAEKGAEAIRRETKMPTPEAIAERVYRLFCQELRREQERRGPRQIKSGYRQR